MTSMIMSSTKLTTPLQIRVAQTATTCASNCGSPPTLPPVHSLVFGSSVPVNGWKANTPVSNAPSMPPMPWTPNVSRLSS